MKLDSSRIPGVESAPIFRALSSDARREILRLLREGPMELSRIMRRTGIGRSSTSRHVQELIDAGLVRVRATPGESKTCRLGYERIVVSFGPISVPEERSVEMEMPIGMYAQVEAGPPCGLASSDGIIGSIDDPQCFLLPDRAAAQLLWIGGGFVEYVFPNPLAPEERLLRVELAMEICSELALHRRDYPSDVTVWINGREIGTWTSFGGLGDDRGRLTPPWWWDSRTQYGMLKVWSVDAAGSFVDGSPISNRRVGDLGITPLTPISVRIGTKAGARNIGNINIFGRRFGNYEQDLLLRLVCVLDEPQHA